jgi:catabolite repression HPr-like protein
MIKKSIKISCPNGLEPRPIAELVQVASKYESKIYLETESKRVNAKSIMGMMSLNLANGDLLTVTSEGNDEKAAMDEITSALKEKLNLTD